MLFEIWTEYLDPDGFSELELLDILGSDCAQEAAAICAYWTRVSVKWEYVYPGQRFFYRAVPEDPEQEPPSDYNFHEELPEPEPVP
jgi:hypothetical protein